MYVCMYVGQYTYTTALHAYLDFNVIILLCRGGAALPSFPEEGP